MMKTETLDADPAPSNKGAGGGRMRRLVRLLGFGGSTGFVKPECEIPPPPAPKEKTKPPEWVAEWDSLVDAYPVGTKFEYLGISMVVTASCKAYATNMVLWADSALWWMAPPIRAEYVDSHGRIREKEFEQRVALKCLPNTKITRGGSR